MIPLPAPKMFWHKLNSNIRKFIWNGKQPRLKFETLQRAKHNGGLALPNFELYHRSSQIKFIKDWLDLLSRVPTLKIWTTVADKVSRYIAQSNVQDSV